MPLFLLMHSTLRGCHGLFRVNFTVVGPWVHRYGSGWWWLGRTSMLPQSESGWYDGSHKAQYCP